MAGGGVELDGAKPGQMMREQEPSAEGRCPKTILRSPGP